jgi:hypothetical protein
MTLHDWETQIRGKMLQLPDRVLYTWDRARNERTARLRPVTGEFLTAHEGDRARNGQARRRRRAGFPFVATGIFDIYRDPRAPQDPKEGLLVDGRRDRDVGRRRGGRVRRAPRRGYDGDNTLVVMDASCWWQQLERDLIAQRANYKGKGSMDIFRLNGFPHVVPPDRASKSNPDIFDRIRATNASIRRPTTCPAFSSTHEVPDAPTASRKWRMHKGKPSRNRTSAHFGDVIGYAVWRFFPRRGQAGKLLSEGGTRDRGELAGAELPGG